MNTFRRLPAATRRPITLTALSALLALGLGLSGCAPANDSGSDQGTSSANSTATSTSTETNSSPEASQSESPESTAPATSTPEGSGGDSGNNGGGQPPAAAGICTAGMLNGTLEPAGSGAGHSYFNLVVNNVSGTTCSIDGYPGVSFVGNGDGTQLGTPADRDPARASSGPVTLAPGGTAQAGLAYTRAENYQNCNRLNSDGLRIYPPSATDALFVPYQLTACSNQGVVLLTIGAFQAR